MVEHSAVNRRVVGSSPTCGANSKSRLFNTTRTPLDFQRAAGARTGRRHHAREGRQVDRGQNLSPHGAVARGRPAPCADPRVRPKGTRSAGETFGDEPLGRADVIVAVIITGSARQIGPPRDDIHGFHPATLAGAIGIGGTETSGSSLIAEPIAFPAVYGEIVARSCRP